MGKQKKEYVISGCYQIIQDHEIHVQESKWCPVSGMAIAQIEVQHD